MVQKVFRTGNSLAVTLPSRFVADIGIKSGDTVRVKILVPQGRIVYQFTQSRQLALDEQIFSIKRKKQ